MPRNEIFNAYAFPPASFDITSGENRHTLGVEVDKTGVDGIQRAVVDHARTVCQACGTRHSGCPCPGVNSMGLARYEWGPGTFEEFVRYLWATATCIKNNLGNRLTLYSKPGPTPPKA